MHMILVPIRNNSCVTDQYLISGFDKVIVTEVRPMPVQFKLCFPFFSLVNSLLALRISPPLILSSPHSWSSSSPVFWLTFLVGWLAWCDCSLDHSPSLCAWLLPYPWSSYWCGSHAVFSLDISMIATSWRSTILPIHYLQQRVSTSLRFCAPAISYLRRPPLQCRGNLR